MKVVKTLYATSDKLKKQLESQDSQVKGLQSRVDSHAFNAQGLINLAQSIGECIQQIVENLGVSPGLSEGYQRDIKHCLSYWGYFVSGDGAPSVPQEMQQVLRALSEYTYVKKHLSDLRIALKSSRLYLVDELWPKHTSGSAHIENPDRQVLIDFLKDGRVLAALGQNHLLDDIYMQLENPGKYKPVIPALNAKQIIIKKETNRKQSAEKVVVSSPSSQEREAAKKNTQGTNTVS